MTRLDTTRRWHESAGLIDLLITAARAKSTVSRDTYKATQVGFRNFIRKNGNFADTF